MMKKRLMGAVLAFSLANTAAAGVVFEDNFDSEAGAAGNSETNYTDFDNWTVSDGTVDVVATPNPWRLDCAGGTGKCVDLDGSNRNAGIFTSTAITLDPGNYLLSFDISGNQRGGSDDLTVTLGGFFNDIFSLSASDPWTTITHGFSVAATTTSSLIFNHAGGDNIGIMLDNVALSEVPEPETIVLFGLGLAGLGLARRKSK